MKNAKIGLIGYKLMGRVHSRAYQDVKMFFSSPILPIKSIICGRHEEAVKKAQKELEWGEYEKDWSKMVKREDVDIVDICTPVYLHRDMVIAAAENGKHILCEKPLAINSNQAKEILEVAQKKQH